MCSHKVPNEAGKIGADEQGWGAASGEDVFGDFLQRPRGVLQRSAAEGDLFQGTDHLARALSHALAEVKSAPGAPVFHNVDGDMVLLPLEESVVHDGVDKDLFFPAHLRPYSCGTGRREAPFRV